MGAGVHSLAEEVTARLGAGLHWAPLPVSLWVRTDGVFRIADVNEMGSEFSGLPREEILGRSASEVGGDQARSTRDMLKALGSEGPVIREVPRVMPAGDVRDLKILYVGCGPDAVLAFVIDLTTQKHAEARLRVTETRYRTLVSAANEGVWLVHRTGRTSFANPKVGRMLGRSLVQLAKGNLLDFVDARDRAAVAAAIKCPRDAPAAFEARFRDGDGHELLCLLSVSAMPGAGAEPETLCLLADLTAVQQERQLREQTEQRFRRMVETASEGVWTGDRDGKTTFANEAIARMLGVDREEILGQSFTDFIVYDELAEAIREELERSGRPARGEFKLRRPDGHVVDVLASLSLLRDEDGRVTGSLAMITDVSVLKREQAEVRESRERFSQIVEEAPVGMAFLGAGHLVRGHFLGANDAFYSLLGYSHEELLDLDMLAITHPDDAEIERPLAAALFENERDEYSLDKRFIRADGSMVWARFRAHVLRDERGAPLYGIGLAVDISAEKAAAAAMADAAARAFAVLDLTPDAVVEMGADGCVVEMNNAALRMFGLDQQEIAGRDLAGTLVPERLRPRFEQALSDWLAASAARQPIEPTETTMMRADGGEFPAELRITTVATGEAPRLMFYVRNLGLYDRAEAGRREAEERFERLFRDAPAAAVAIDLQGRLTDVNPAFCKLAARDALALIGREAVEVLADAGDAHEAPWRTGTERPGPLRAARRVIRPDGQTLAVEVTASLVRDAAGSPSHWICQCTPKLLAGAESLPESDSLSYRERQVLSLLAHGHDGPAIAERLGLSPETVRSYAQSAREKMGAKTRTEAVALALVRGEIAV